MEQLSEAEAREILTRCKAMTVTFMDLRPQAIKALLVEAKAYGFEKHPKAAAAVERCWHGYLVDAARIGHPAFHPPPVDTD